MTLLHGLHDGLHDGLHGLHELHDTGIMLLILRTYQISSSYRALEHGKKCKAR